MVPVNFNGWLGGLNESTPSAELGPAELNANENWDYADRGELVMRTGSLRYTDYAGLPADVQTMARVAYDGDASRVFLATAGTNLYLISGAGAATAVGSGFPPPGYSAPAAPPFTAGKRFDFAQQFNQVFMANGVEKVHMYDPSTNDLSVITDANCPKPVAINFFENTLFALNDPTAGATDPTEFQRLRYADRGDATTWGASNFVDFRVPKGGQGVAIITRGDHQVVFFSDSIWKLYGSSKETFLRVPLTLDLGAVSAHGIAVLPDGTIEFVSHSGVYAILSDRVLLASHRISLRASGITTAQATYDVAGRRFLAKTNSDAALIQSHKGPPTPDIEQGRVEMGPWGTRQYGAGLVNAWSTWNGPGDSNQIFFAVENHIFQLTGTTDLTVPRSVTSITRSGSTATATATGHPWSNGDSVWLDGAVQPEYNGTFVIFNVTTNTFDYTVTGTPASPATGTIWAWQVLDIVSTARTGDFDPSGEASMSRLRWMYVNHQGGDALIINVTRDYGTSYLQVVFSGIGGLGSVLVWGVGNWDEDLWGFDIANIARMSVLELIFAHRFALEFVCSSQLGHTLYNARADFITREMEIFA